MRTREPPGPAGLITDEPPAPEAAGPDARPGRAVPSPAAVAAAAVPDPGPPPPPSPLELPGPRTPPRQRSELSPAGGGAARGDDLAFRARVDPDGTVHLEDKRNLRVGLALPSPAAIGRGLERWYAAPYGNTPAEERPRDEPQVVPIVRGGFDLTDWAMRRAGQDPYAARKRAFLDRTFEERAGMAAVAERERLRESIAHLSRFLADVWAHTAWPPAERRRVLFELWDECAEDGSAQVVAAADRARATIEAFIRKTLPAGSPHAYPDDELAALNASRTSGRPFAPYR